MITSDEGRSKHPNIFIKVDFPDPEGPMMATYSPASTSNVIFLGQGLQVYLVNSVY